MYCERPEWISPFLTKAEYILARNLRGILDDFIKERWSHRFSIDTYEHIASYYIDEVPLNGKRLLDIGCGNGLMLSTNCIVAKPKLAVGIDNYQGEGSPTSDYHFAKKVQSRLSLPCLKLLLGDAFKLPFHENTFDMIYVSHCLHHIYESRVRLRKAEESATNSLTALLGDIYTTLADDGVAVVAEVPRYSIQRFGRLFGLLKDTDFQTKQEPRDWIYALKKAGFKRFRVKYHTPYPLRRFKKILSNRVGRYILCGQYYIFAYKG
ncbi:MAG: class I SAM-dependent methyltransferase [Thermodesulfobacteriota bacterium]